MSLRSDRPTRRSLTAKDELDILSAYDPPRPVAQLLVDLGVARSHSGIALHPPCFGAPRPASQGRQQRRQTLHATYAANPARSRRRRPEAPAPPIAARINQPSREALIQSN